MPYVTVLETFVTGDGAEQRIFVGGEVARLPMGDPLLQVHRASIIMDSDMEIVKVCSCGRAFACLDHIHFTLKGHKVAGGSELLDESKLGEAFRVQREDMPNAYLQEATA